MEQGKSKSLRLSNGGKLVARDLSESLGKLPPQNLEMEEAVLGAIMLEKAALPIVIPFLKPDHFYVETHLVIYQAILELHADGDPIDMRTVVNRLRKTGKLELVGGQFRIAEITGAVSSSANIEAHARVIVEASVKRELIQIASKIHHQAYEDTTDAFELLDKITAEFEFFSKNATPENSATKIEALWLETLITQAPEEQPPLMTINGTPIATQGNHSLLVGKKKSRKTLFVVWLISEYLKQNPDNATKVLLFDTEQGKKHVFKIRDKIHQITGLYVPIFYLRGQSPAERKDFIRHTVEFWKTPPVWIVIDGIRDLMSNINDPDESTDLIVWLEKITLQKNVHVTNILHLNKTDNNARGHIGSELLNKAEVTIEMELDEKNGCTNVKCESSRERGFDTFSFTHDKDGLPIVVGNPIGGQILPPDEKKLRLEQIFDSGPLRYNELLEEMKAQFGLGTSRAKTLIAEFVRTGWIIRNGNARAAGTVYKLMVSTNGHYTNQPTQTALALEPPKVDADTVDTSDLPF